MLHHFNVLFKSIILKILICLICLAVVKFVLRDDGEERCWECTFLFAFVLKQAQSDISAPFD